MSTPESKDVHGPWEAFCRRTNDPKLRYLEYRLGCMGIQHRRDGESFHAPILEVRSADIGDAWKLLDEKIEGTTLDELPDDHPMFVEWDRAHRLSIDPTEAAVREEDAWHEELNRSYTRDRF